MLKFQNAVMLDRYIYDISVASYTPAATSSSAGDIGQSTGVTSADTSSSAGDSGQSAGCSGQLMGKGAFCPGSPSQNFSLNIFVPTLSPEKGPRQEIEGKGSLQLPKK